MSNITPTTSMLEEVRQCNGSGCTCSSYFMKWKYKIRKENK